MKKDNIEYQIDITYKMIEIYNKKISNLKDDNFKEEVKIRLQKEINKLNWYKENYTEYFI